MAATVASAFALVSAEPADAHFSLVPAVVMDGGPAELVAEVPAGAAETVSVTAAGPGLELLSSSRAGTAPAGESRWLLRVRVAAPAGPLPVVVSATDRNGGTATFRTSLTVVPAPNGGGAWRWAVAAAGALVAAGLGLVALRVARRRA